MAYQPIQLPTAQGFGLADAVMAARQEQRQKQQDAWQQIIQQGQAERAQQELALRQQQQAFHQAQAQHEQQQADQERTLKLHSMIGELHEKGLSHEAQQIAGMFGLTPQTQDRGLMPMEPSKPEPAQQPEFVGPLETPEDAAARAAMDVQGVGKQQGPATEPPPFVPPEQVEQASSQAASEVERQQALRDKFGEAQKAEAAYPGQMEQFGKDMAAFQEATQNAPVTYSGAGGSFTIDPRERIMAAREQSKRRAESVRGALSGTPETQGFAPRIAAEVGAGRDLEKAMEDQNKRELAGMGGANKLEVAKLKAKKGGGGGGGGFGNAKETKLAQAMEAAAKAGKPLTEGEIYAEADKLGLAHNGKPSQPSAANVIKRFGELERGRYIDFRKDERMAGLQATDASGNVIGTWKSPTDAQQMNRQTAQFDQVRQRLADLIGDIERTGDRALTPDETQHRNSLFDLAAAAGRVYNGLGATDASQRLEQEILAARGTLGHGWLIGANRKVVQHLLDEATHQHDVRLNLRLRADNTRKTPEGGGESKAAKSEVPAGLPEGTVPAGKTKDGRNAYRLPNGKLVAE